MDGVIPMGIPQSGPDNRYLECRKLTRADGLPPKWTSRGTSQSALRRQLWKVVDHSPGGHEADQGVEHIHREEQGAQGWGLASRVEQCSAGGGPEMAAGCTTMQQISVSKCLCS